MSKVIKTMEETTALDLCSLLALTYSQMLWLSYQKVPVKSENENVKIFPGIMQEPGATYAALEESYNTWNAICVEAVYCDDYSFVCYCRYPDLTFDDELFDQTKEEFKNRCGKEVEFRHVRMLRKGEAQSCYYDVWELFGGYMAILADDSEESKSIVDAYFGTYGGTTDPNNLK